MASGVKQSRGADLDAGILRTLGEVLPGIRVAERSRSRPAAWDFTVTLGSGKTVRRLLVECKSVGEPRYLAQAITRLSLAARKVPRSHPVVAAPYIGPEGQRLCREAGVGYVDLAGNVYLRFDGVLVDRRSAERPARTKTRLRRLFAPRSSRIARVLLEHPGADWTLARLAGEATVSLRTAHLVVNALVDKAFVKKRRGAIQLHKPGELLDLWAETYRVDQHRRHTYYSFVRNPRELAAALAAAAAREGLALALTLHSGAALVAPFVRASDVHAYALGDLDRLVRAADLRPVETGGNVHLLVPDDEGVLYRTQTVDGLPVVCNTQLYLDLVHYPARGAEQAAELRRQKLGF